MALNRLTNTNFVGTTTVIAGSSTRPGLAINGGSNYSPGLFSPNIDYLGISTSGIQRLIIDPNGNVGIGVVPSPWRGISPILQAGYGAYFLGNIPGKAVHIGLNHYFDGSNFVYTINDYSTRYDQTLGQHQWYTASPGLPGSAISFTQAMTLDASSNLSTLGSISDLIGNVRDIPINNQSIAYTLVASDRGKCIVLNTGSTGVTIPSGVFSAGATIAIYNNTGSSQTITQGASVTAYLAGVGTTGNRTLAVNGFCSAICIASNTFILMGAGLS